MYAARVQDIDGSGKCMTNYIKDWQEKSQSSSVFKIFPMLIVLLPHQSDYGLLLLG